MQTTRPPAKELSYLPSGTGVWQLVWQLYGGWLPPKRHPETKLCLARGHMGIRESRLRQSSPNKRLDNNQDLMFEQGLDMTWTLVLKFIFVLPGLSEPRLSNPYKFYKRIPAPMGRYTCTVIANLHINMDLVKDTYSSVHALLSACLGPSGLTSVNYCSRGPLLSNIREFKDAVFEDVVFDNNMCYLILYLKFTWYGVTKLSLSNSTSSNTTSLNSRLVQVPGRTQLNNTSSYQ